jgi:hypothetical protein
MIDNYPSLSTAGYSIIVGVRDLYPLETSDLRRLDDGLRKILPKNGTECDIVIAVREVESWFIQEKSHYSAIDSNLTLDLIESKMGFKFDTDCAEDIDWPSDWLKKSYQIVGKSYTKKKTHVDRTVDALDMCSVYFDLPSRLKSLSPLASRIEEFLQ